MSNYPIFLGKKNAVNRLGVEIEKVVEPLSTVQEFVVNNESDQVSSWPHQLICFEWNWGAIGMNRSIHLPMNGMDNKKISNNWILESVLSIFSVVRTSNDEAI